MHQNQGLQQAKQPDTENKFYSQDYPGTFGNVQGLFKITDNSEHRLQDTAIQQQSD